MQNAKVITSECQDVLAPWCLDGPTAGLQEGKSLDKVSQGAVGQVQELRQDGQCCKLWLFINLPVRNELKISFSIPIGDFNGI